MDQAMYGIDCRLFRPYRATVFFGTGTQGVALGWIVTGLSGRADEGALCFPVDSIRRKAHLDKMRADGVRTIGANRKALETLQ